MKKLIITAACAVAAVSGFAQGTVQFANTATSAIYLTTNVAANKVTSGTIASMTGAASGPGASTGTIEVGLYWSTSAFSTLGTGTLAGTETISATVGLVNGNAVFALPGSNAGDTDFIQIYAWDSTYATPQAAVAAGGYFGASSAGAANTVYGAIGSAYSITLGATAGPGTPIFSPTGTIGKDILLAQTPEPATIVLGGLGAAALLLFRRRK